VTTAQTSVKPVTVINERIDEKFVPVLHLPFRAAPAKKKREVDEEREEIGVREAERRRLRGRRVAADVGSIRSLHD